MSKLLDGIPENLIHEDEQALAARIQKTGTERDCNLLVMHNIREALAYARHCCRCQLREDEVFSLCYAALMKAAPRFRPGGIRFFAYAKQDVRGELSRHWKTLDVVHNASQHQEELPAIKRQIGVAIDGIGSQEKEYLSFEPEDEPYEPDYVEPEFDRIEMNERWALVAPLLDSLKDSERIILKLHYESGFSFQEIADMLVPRVSRQTIGNTHHAAIAKLQTLVRRKTPLAK